MDISETADAVGHLALEAVDAIHAQNVKLAHLAFEAARRHLDRLEALALDQFRTDGFTYQDIGDELGVTKQAVRQRRERLKK